MSALIHTLPIVSFGLAAGILVSAAAWRLVKELAIPGSRDAADRRAPMPPQAAIAVSLILGGAAGLATLSRVPGFSTPTGQEWESGLLAYGLAQLWYLAALFARIVEDPTKRALIGRVRDGLGVVLSLALVIATVASIAGVARQGSMSLLGASAITLCLAAALVMVNHWRAALRSMGE